MIDPVNFTRYDLDKNGLQEYILFCIAVFNKNADQTAVKLEKFLNFAHGVKTRNKVLSASEDGTHFNAVLNAEAETPMFELVKRFKFGNTTVKAKGFSCVARSGLDLTTCSEDDLDEIPGIGMKTARYFTLHTRPDHYVACLDTHVLRYLRESGYEDIPDSTPSRKRYLEIEAVFLDIADLRGMSPARLDLEIWNSQRGSYELLVKSQTRKAGNSGLASNGASG